MSPPMAWILPGSGRSAASSAHSLAREGSRSSSRAICSPKWSTCAIAWRSSIEGARWPKAPSGSSSSVPQPEERSFSPDRSRRPRRSSRDFPAPRKFAPKTTRWSAPPSGARRYPAPLQPLSRTESSSPGSNAPPRRSKRCSWKSLVGRRCEFGDRGSVIDEGNSILGGEHRTLDTEHRLLNRKEMSLRFLPLVENEVLKLLKQRRFRVVFLILVALIGLIVFAQAKGRQRFLTGRDWRVRVAERVAGMQNAVRTRRMPQTAERWTRFEIARLQYHLDRGIDPDAISGPLFVRIFANASSYLLLPLLALVFASDIVSCEFTQGTIKLLLTRPVGRARVLAAKLAALCLAITVMVLVGGLVAYGFGGLAFGYRGWGAPVLTAFHFAGGTFDTA